MKRRATMAAVCLVVILVGAGVYLATSSGYRVTLVLPAASNLVVGTPFEVNGRPAGTVSEIRTQDQRALVTLRVDGAYAPLRDGTTAQIAWKSLLGQRVLVVRPGPATNPGLPDGALIEGTVAPVEFDDVLSTLDADTRSRLNSLVHQLNSTLGGHEQDVTQTLATAGPAVDALGRVVDRIGADGPAISQVVTRLNDLASAAAQRRADVSGSIQHLAGVAEVLSQRRDQLRATLHELPGTLGQVRDTLDQVPAATDATVPLLHSLAGATSQLPRTADSLAPLLTDLRSAASDLAPTVEAAHELLGQTPDLLDTTHAVFPPLRDALRSSRNAVAFLRPYTPEIAGFFVNWGSFAAPIDGNGHYVRVLAPQSATSFTNNPGLLPPGFRIDRAPLPGSLEGQPWTDAAGDGPR